MAQRDDGGPAFPVQGQQIGTDTEGAPILAGQLHHGMTLRDWFAGQALAGMLANPNTTGPASPASALPSAVATFSYAIADAMLAERAKGRG